MDNLKRKIEDYLGNFWDERAIETGGEPYDVSDLGVPMDSLTSIEVLLEIDKLFGRTIPVETVIKKGGYQTREEFVEEVSSKVLTFVAENPNG